MKPAVQHLHFTLPTACFEFLLSQFSYRIAMPVREVLVYQSAWTGETGYYVCPRCHIALEREFVSFCDRCGQNLDWGDYKNTTILYPGTLK